MSWFEKLMPSRISTEKRTRSVPEGVWIKCQECDAQLYRTELERNLYVCPKCDYHMRIGARRRLEYFLDPDSQQEIAASLESRDPLRFKDSKKYKDRISQAQKKTGEKDALPPEPKLDNYRMNKKHDQGKNTDQLENEARGIIQCEADRDNAQREQ